MDRTEFASYLVEDRSYLSYIKREIHNAVLTAGFPSMRAGEVDIVVAEMCSNLVKHAQSGELLYRIIIEEEEKIAFEILCIDSGPGFSDFPAMMRDGASTTSTLGHGLGAINRQSDFFQVYTIDGWGTVMYAKLYHQPIEKNSYRRVAPKGLTAKCLGVCMPSEKLCGDGWHVKTTDTHSSILLADGLGHGEFAYEAAQKGIEAFIECEDTDPVNMLRYMHQKVKKTRGMVATIAVLSHQRKQWTISGIGNITTRLFDGQLSKNCISHNGIVGLNIPGTITAANIDALTYPSIIMYSDGLRNRLDMLKFPLLLKYDPIVIAGALYKEYARKTDDMTVLVGKANF